MLFLFRPAPRARRICNQEKWCDFPAPAVPQRQTEARYNPSNNGGLKMYLPPLLKWDQEKFKAGFAREGGGRLAPTLYPLLYFPYAVESFGWG